MKKHFSLILGITNDDYLKSSIYNSVSLMLAMG